MEHTHISEQLTALCERSSNIVVVSISRNSSGEHQWDDSLTKLSDFLRFYYVKSSDLSSLVQTHNLNCIGMDNMARVIATTTVRALLLTTCIPQREMISRMRQSQPIMAAGGLAMSSINHELNDKRFRRIGGDWVHAPPTRPHQSC